MPGDPRNHYIPRMDWAGNSTQLVVQQLNRLQNEADLLLADAATGAVRASIAISDEAWVDVNDELRADRRRPATYLWVSESSGWRHVYRVARDGSGGASRSRGVRFDVAAVCSVDEQSGWLYFHRVAG